MPLRLPVRSSLLHVALISLAAFTAACAKAERPAADTATPVSVRTAAAAETGWAAQFEAGGALKARTAATIASRVTAPVVIVSVRAGDRVRRGQVLIRLDGATLVAGAARASAQASGARDGAAAADADVAAAESARALAKATHARIADLAANRAATAQELDEATAALSGAESRLTGARARRSQAASAQDAAAANQRAADADASYLTITAPFDGVIANRAIDPGSMAAPGMPLLTLEAPGLQFEMRVDAARAADVAVGQHVEVRIDSDPANAAAAAGRVSEISLIDAGAHHFGVKVDVAANAGWRSGLFGRARFTGATRRTIAIQASAVVHRGQLAFVFVVADGHARLRAVSLGEKDGTRVEVLDGLAAGERIVLTPPAALADGAAITQAGGPR